MILRYMYGNGNIHEIHVHTSQYLHLWAFACFGYLLHRCEQVVVAFATALCGLKKE